MGRRNRQQKVKTEEKKQEETSTAEKDKTSTVTQTFVFLDVEATALPCPNRKKIPDMTEIAMIAVPRKAFTKASAEGVTPRVQDKLVMCVAPRKQVASGTEEKTGLSKELLEKYGKQETDQNLIMSIKCFLLRQVQPICLVAHAGDNFDFKILKREVDKIEIPGLSDCSLYAADSLLFFQKTLPDESHTLADLCDNHLEYVYDASSHDAEADSDTLLDLVAHKDFTTKFLNWIELNKTEYEI